ncbi:hypothetical protein AB0C38_13750 [Amycolatopsis sp. NPDC048633]|uniref:hypothetical protein n=1 Tax=Amycolatopsis sp. NPDC048633 TaxID=3157095 RepID=UPI0033FA3AFA
MSIAVRSFFFAIAAAAALGVSRLLQSPTLRDGPLVVISAVLGVLLAAVVERVVLRLPLRFKKLRRLVDRRAAFEGIWLIDVQDQPERPVALAVIEYNPINDDYNYHGVAFDPSYQVRATWQSSKTLIDLDHNQLAHIGEGTLVGDPAETVRNFGLLSFDRNHKGKYTRGYAFFVDFGSVPIKRFYTMERILDSPTLSSHDDVRQYLIAHAKSSS